MDQKELLKYIEAYEYVSFDLFDTLMFRTVEHPSDVFDIVQYLYSEATDFKRARMDAEATVRKKNRGREITIDEIYQAMPYAADVCKYLMNLEKQVEIRNCVPNEAMMEVLSCCIQSQKHVVITTDMYLDRSTIEEILAKIGAEYEFLFISGEEKVTKLSGKLYDRVLDILGIAPEQMVHIGDNPMTDLAMARRKKIASYERCVFPQAMGVGEQIGRQILGPLLLSFCRWIHDWAKRECVDRLFFVAREGYLLKLVYETMYPDECGAVAYLRLNKNMTRLPALYLNPTIEQFLKTIPYRKSYRWREVLEFLQVKEPVEVGLSPDEVFSRDDMKSASFRSCFECLAKRQMPIWKEQYELLIAYLVENGCSSGKYFLVNNSLNGNTQMVLENILKQADMDACPVGMQFAISETGKRNLQGRYHAWFDEMGVPIYRKMVFGQYAVVFEHLLFENSGTARSLMESGDQIVIVCDDKDREAENEAIIHPIWKETLRCTANSTSFFGTAFDMCAVERLFRLLLCPSRKEALMIGGLMDVEYDGCCPLVNASMCQKLSSWRFFFQLWDYRFTKWAHGAIALREKNSVLRYLYGFSRHIICVYTKMKQSLGDLCGG